MGEAYDRTGHFLGSVEAASKAEVLQKLEKQFGDKAHEVRIHSLSDRAAEDASRPSASAELPRYKCHKEVWALKIAEIHQAPADQERVYASGDWYLVPEDRHYAPICVGHDEFIVKHKPQAGGYYVVYPPDGYASFSPAKPFEDGYSRL